MPKIPAKLIGDTHGEQAFNDAVDYMKSLRPMRGNGVQVNHTIFGVSRKTPRRTPTSSASSSGNWNYRGGYTPTPALPYMTFDVVLLGSGTSAGMYLSTIDGNNNSPDSGIGWVQVSTGTGVWL